MRFSCFSKLGVQEAKAEAYHTIIEGYGRRNQFPYANFNVDPKPDVLVLGHWTHPNTGNDLLGGVNLHYLSTQQVERLRKSLPKLLQRKGLQARYRFGKRYLPDIFKNYYRTYDKQYIHQIEPDTLRFWAPNADKKRAEQEKRRQEKEQLVAQRAKDAALAQRADAVQDKPEVDPDDPGLTKQAWRIRELEQEKAKEIEKQAAIKSRLPTRRSIEKDEDELDQIDLMAQTEKEAEQAAVGPDFTDEEEDLKDELRDEPDRLDPNLESLSPTDYVESHDYSKYAGKPKSVIYNALTGQMIVDSIDQVAMLAYADWEYDHTVRFQIRNNRLHVLREGNDPINKSILRAAWNALNKQV